MKHFHGPPCLKRGSTYVLVLGALVIVNVIYLISSHIPALHGVQAHQQGGSNQRQVKLRSTGLLGADSTAANSRGSQGANVHDHSSSRTADQAADHGSATRTSGPVSGKPAELSNAAKYLKQVVFNDKAWAQRKPMTDYWLQHTSAPNKTLEEYRGRVDTYLKSQEFQDRWKALKNQVGNERGIVMSAGGKYYLPQAIVMLRVLRHHHRSKLPVELFWYGDEEMDAETLKNLKAEFDPLEGYDVTKEVYPSHHLPGATLKGFPMKPYALLKSRFKEAFLLDCDVILHKDPAYMFEAPLYKERGNYFWDDIYGYGMVKDEVYEYVGLNKSVKDVLNEGKGEFNRYAESGQVMINRAMHLDVLEWTWFLNSFSKGFIYEFMYGDKDTYGLAFALAGKAHLYQHMNTPPAGVFTGGALLGWKPRQTQMNKQGNWWLHALGHYDHEGELLLIHRVTGEVTVGMGKAPTDELITPPIPQSWSMWFMGYGPDQKMLRAIDVMNYNVTYLLATAPPGQECPLAAWSAYWTLRTHGIPVQRNLTLERKCDQMLDAEYGSEAADMIRKSTLMQHPLRLVVNEGWDAKVDGGWNAPKNPLWGVPVNMTGVYTTWQHLDESVAYAKKWIYEQHKAPVLSKA